MSSCFLFLLVLCSQMGVSNDSHVVVYDNSPNMGFYSVGRVWWMFKVSNHGDS